MEWCIAYSLSFSVSNGVKQSAIISPILFCVYLDALLHVKFSEADGCQQIAMLARLHIMREDLLGLLTPFASAMRRILLTCDKFSAEHNVSFNACE